MSNTSEKGRLISSPPLQTQLYDFYYIFHFLDKAI